MSVGNPDEPTAVGRIPLEDLSVGEEIPRQAMTVTSADHEQRMATAAEVLPWGNSVLIPSSVVGLLYQPCVATVRAKSKPCTGIFGAIEIRNINGPTLVDTPYTVHGKVLALGQSPKTELLWYETYADDDSGTRVAEMRMLIRMMKNSSPLYSASEL